jgi:hypothetical protein
VWGWGGGVQRLGTPQKAKGMDLVHKKAREGLHVDADEGPACHDDHQLTDFNPWQLHAALSGSRSRNDHVIVTKLLRANRQFATI